MHLFYRSMRESLERENIKVTCWYLICLGINMQGLEIWPVSLRWEVAVTNNFTQFCLRSQTTVELRPTYSIRSFLDHIPNSSPLKVAPRRRCLTTSSIPILNHAFPFTSRLDTARSSIALWNNVRGGWKGGGTMYCPVSYRIILWSQSSLRITGTRRKEA